MNKNEKKEIISEIISNLRIGTYYFLFEKSGEFFVHYVDNDDYMREVKNLIEKRRSIGLNNVVSAKIKYKDLDRVRKDKKISLARDQNHLQIFKKLITYNYIHPIYIDSLHRKDVKIINFNMERDH